LIQNLFRRVDRGREMRRTDRAGRLKIVRRFHGYYIGTEFSVQGNTARPLGDEFLMFSQVHAGHVEESRKHVPAPQASMMKELAKLQFRAAGLVLPVNWQPPSGDPAPRHYRDAFKSSELISVPQPVPPGLFMAASVNKYHCDTAKEMSNKFQSFIDGICGAICSAWGTWQSSASMVGVVINAVTAVGGQVVGRRSPRLSWRAHPRPHRRN
jgi:hypothetical protein